MQSYRILCGIFICVFLFPCSAWVTEDNIWGYAENKERFGTATRSFRGFQEGIDAMEEIIKKQGPGPVGGLIDIIITDFHFTELLQSTCSIAAPGLIPPRPGYDYDHWRGLIPACGG